MAAAAVDDLGGAPRLPGEEEEEEQRDDAATTTTTTAAPAPARPPAAVGEVELAAQRPSTSPPPPPPLDPAAAKAAADLEKHYASVQTVADGVTLPTTLASVAAAVRADADVDALAALIVKVGQVLRAEPSIREIDLNPVILHPAGEGVVALDALMLVD